MRSFGQRQPERITADGLTNKFRAKVTDCKSEPAG